MFLKGKTALITGSTSGIGLAYAKALAAEGAAIVINGFGDAAAIEQERAALEATSGARAIYSGHDLTKVDQIEAMMKEALDTFGSVDILINNAGIQHVAPVEEFPLDKWDLIIALNLNSAFHTTRLALPGMKAKKWGRIIQTASAHSLTASPFKSAYVTAKHGLAGFTKTVALETARSGVTVNAICPGWVLTPLVQKQIDDRAAKEGIPVTQATTEMLQEKEPSLRFTTPEHLGELAVFLCSPAADNVLGVAWNMDGGWTAQ